MVIQAQSLLGIPSQPYGMIHAMYLEFLTHGEVILIVLFANTR